MTTRAAAIGHVNIIRVAPRSEEQRFSPVSRELASFDIEGKRVYEYIAGGILLNPDHRLLGSSANFRFPDGSIHRLGLEWSKTKAGDFEVVAVMRVHGAQLRVPLDQLGAEIDPSSIRRPSKTR